MKKRFQKQALFPFTAQIYKLDNRGNEIYSDIDLKTGEPIVDVITLTSFSSYDEAFKEATQNAPQIGCFGYKIVILENEEEVFCRSYMF